MSNFKNYLLKLGYSKEDMENYLQEDEFIYPLDVDSNLYVKYIDTPTKEDVFNQHKVLWNKNTDIVFIAACADKSYLINVRRKPNSDQIFKPGICIESFDYGVNTEGYSSISVEKISKDYIDSSYFFDFVSKNLLREEEVDKDLLLNLLALRNDLRKRDNGKVVHLLILRCLFVKYLEDRGIFDKDYLVSILRDGSARKLISAFNQIRKINGDVFKYDQFTSSDIEESYLGKLERFFTTDYRYGQGTLFPYQFDQIPIQLISHVYEAFLKNDAKKGKGIYYTPFFLVNFILKSTLEQKVKENSTCKVLDPAVGSGAFLVESFKILQRAYGTEISFEAKKKILESQLYGIDVDRSALQITAFSLYLALLETETPEFIRNKIEHSSPILPSLIGKSLVHGNALLDNSIFNGDRFDCILSNPPWGSVSDENNDGEREAISGGSIDYPEYNTVADYEKSQAFLVRAKRWSHANTIFAMVVKNSTFLNDGAREFRKKILRTFNIDAFYELSHYNKILFKKREIGKLRNGEKVEIGASEPCVVIVYSNLSDGINQTIKYISPKLTPFARHINSIHYTSRDITILNKEDLILNDSLWKVLVNGDKEDYDLIEKKLVPQKGLLVEARAGFQPKKNMKSLGNPLWKTLIQPQDFVQFYLTDRQLKKFNWNQELHRARKESIFNDSRIVISVRPLKSDNLLFRGLHLSQEIVFKDNIIGVKLKANGEYVKDHLPYLGLINSQLIGFLFYHLSIQWGKGEGKRDTLRNLDIEALPIKNIEGTPDYKLLKNLVIKIQDLKSKGNDPSREINQMNELVFNLYGLLDYEKEIVKEFYQIRVERAERESSIVKTKDIQIYFKAFKRTFSLILSSKHTISATYKISSLLGAIIRISIIEKEGITNLREDSDTEILRLVKSKQLGKAEAVRVLYEEKVKIYNKDCFYIIKSNQFKDWTVRQAIRDAREEIEQFMKHLSVKDGHAS